MPYLFNKIDQCNMLLVEYDKTTTYDDRLKLIDELVEVFHENPTYKAIIDTRGSLKTLNQIDEEHEEKFGKVVAAKLKKFIHNKIALITHDYEDRAFMLATAYLDGFNGILQCHTMTEAIQWVNGEIR